MSGVITPGSALRYVPGWDDACITELHGGLNNRSYKVTASGRSGVLKIDDAPRGAPFNTRSAEAQVQNTAADAGLAPHVWYADERIYFTEFLEGDVWHRPCLDKPGNLQKLAAALRRVHALPLTGRTFDAVGAAQRYAETSRTMNPELTDYCTTMIEKMRRPHNLCCCHNDLVAENLLSTPGLKFLDWEYACDNDPLFDLATLVEHHELSEEQAATLLHAYLSGNGDVRLSQLSDQRKLYLALLWLWMAARPDSDPHELERVAERLTGYCRE